MYQPAVTRSKLDRFFFEFHSLCVQNQNLCMSSYQQFLHGQFVSSWPNSSPSPAADQVGVHFVRPKYCIKVAEIFNVKAKERPMLWFGMGELFKTTNIRYFNFQKGDVNL